MNIQLLLETGGRSKAKSSRHLAFGSPQHWHDAVKNDPDPSCVSSILSFPDFFLKSSSEEAPAVNAMDIAKLTALFARVFFLFFQHRLTQRSTCNRAVKEQATIKRKKSVTPPSPSQQSCTPGTER